MKVLSIFVIYRICHLECHFNSVIHEADFLNPEHLFVLSDDPISDGSLQW